jgi:hypothetical protein
MYPFVVMTTKATRTHTHTHTHTDLSHNTIYMVRVAGYTWLDVSFRCRVE